MKKLLSIVFIFIAFFISAFQVSAQTSGADLVVTNFQLTNDKGVAKTSFAPNEPIYIKYTIKNQGTQTATNKYTSAGHIWSQIYGNKSSTVSYETGSDVGIWIRNYNNITPGKVITYGSYPNGPEAWAFEGAKFFKKSNSGTYTARAFVNYDKIANEGNFSNNQITVTYTIKNPVTPTATPVPTRTPTPTPKPTIPPAAVTGVCTNNSISLSFNSAPSGTVKWAIRIDDRSNGWRDTQPLEGDTMLNDFTGTKYNRSGQPGKAYSWWVHPLNAKNEAITTYSGDFYCPVGKVTGLSHSYNYPTVTLKWNPVAGAKYYAIRVDNHVNGWDPNNMQDGDHLRNELTETSFSFRAARGRAISWWIHAIDQNGNVSEASGESFVNPQ